MAIATALLGFNDLGLSVTPTFFQKQILFTTLVVDVQQNYPRWCIGIGIGLGIGIGIGIGIGRGKSLTCITAVESTTSPIVITLGSSILMKCLPPY